MQGCIRIVWSSEASFVILTLQIIRIISRIMLCNSLSSLTFSPLKHTLLLSQPVLTPNVKTYWKKTDIIINNVYKICCIIFCFNSYVLVYSLSKTTFQLWCKNEIWQPTIKASLENLNRSFKCNTNRQLALIYLFVCYS